MPSLKISKDKQHSEKPSFPEFYKRNSWNRKYLACASSFCNISISAFPRGFWPRSSALVPKEIVFFLFSTYFVNSKTRALGRRPAENPRFDEHREPTEGSEAGLDAVEAGPWLISLGFVFFFVINTLIPQFFIKTFFCDQRICNFSGTRIWVYIPYELASICSRALCGCFFSLSLKFSIETSQIFKFLFIKNIASVQDSIHMLWMFYLNFRGYFYGGFAEVEKYQSADQMWIKMGITFVNYEVWCDSWCKFVKLSIPEIYKN